MILENIELCMNILLILADEQEYPSQLHFVDIQAKFSDKSEAELMMCVHRLRQANLLQGGVTVNEDKVSAAHFTGLTLKGDDFVMASKNETIWRLASEECVEKFGSLRFAPFVEILIKTEFKTELCSPVKFD